MSINNKPKAPSFWIPKGSLPTHIFRSIHGFKMPRSYAGSNSTKMINFVFCWDWADKSCITFSVSQSVYAHNAYPTVTFRVFGGGPYEMTFIPLNISCDTFRHRLVKGLKIASNSFLVAFVKSADGPGSEGRNMAIFANTSSIHKETLPWVG